MAATLTTALPTALTQNGTPIRRSASICFDFIRWLCQADTLRIADQQPL
jgi:hypothetical protein